MLFSRQQFCSILSAGLSRVSGALTNAQAKRIGVNLAGPNSFEYGRTYLDFTRRFAQKFFDGTSGSTPATLKANKAPAATYHYTLTANLLASDAGVYNCGMPGGATGFATSIGSFGTPTYDAGNDRTTLSLTLPGPNVGGPVITITNPSTSSDYLRIVPAGYDPFTNGNDFHPHLLARLTAYGASTVRGMDWLDTNNAGAETSWAGSTAAGGDGSIRTASRSLTELVRLSNVANVDLQFNATPSANTDWMTNSLNYVSATLKPALYVNCEYSNEPWNNQAGGNGLTHLPQAMTLGGSFSFGATGALRIVSIVRASNVVTVTLGGPPANTTGPFVVFGVTNITGGFIDVVGKGLVVTGNTFTYNETGADVTGVAPNPAYNSYVHTNPTHYLVRGLTTIGDPTNLGVTLYIMVYRYIIEQTRAWWVIAQSLPDKARFRFILNEQFGVNEYITMPYAIERFGDADWIYQGMTAPYFSAASLADTATVFSQLTAALAAFPKILVTQANAALSYGKKVGYYEGGPSLATPTTGAQGIVASAVQQDPQIGVLITSLLTSMRDLGQSSAFNFFKDGCSASFAGTVGGENYNLLDADPTVLTGPKPQALIQWANQSSVPQPVNGLTWGTINILDVTAIGTSSAGVRVFFTGTLLPDFYFQIVAPADGTYPLSIFASSNSASDWLTTILNAVTLGNQVPMQTSSGFTVSATPQFTGTVTLHAGVNILILRLKPATRAGFNNLGTIVVG